MVAKDMSKGLTTLAQLQVSANILEYQMRRCFIEGIVPGQPLL